MIDWIEEYGMIGGWLVFMGAFAWCWDKLFNKCRHAYYKNRAQQVLKKIRKIEGEGTAARKMAYLRRINPYVFEELLLLAYEKKGHRVIRNRRYSGDGGVDGWVIINRKRIPVQAKRYSGHIRREHVEAFSLLVQKKKAPYGLFIHTGRTGKGSSGQMYPNVHIISGERLLDLFKETDNRRERMTFRIECF